MGALPPEEEVGSSSPYISTSDLLLAEEEQTAEEERQRRLQAVFNQRIGASAKDLKITQTPEEAKIKREKKEPELMPGLSWENLASDSLVLSFENPVWLASSRWWNTPKEIKSPKLAKSQFPEVDFGEVEADEEFSLFNHQSLEVHVRPILKRDSFGLFYAREPEYEEEGVEVEQAFLEARTLEVTTRNWVAVVPKEGFLSQEECLKSVWQNLETKPMRPLGGTHISRLTKYDYPVRVTPFPRPLFLDFGYPLQFNFLSNLIQLEVRDYALEVEDSIRRSLNNSDSPQLMDVVSRHRLEHLVREKTAELLTKESGEGELLLRHFPLFPLLKPNEAKQFHPILQENQAAWRVFASEEYLPFHYSSAFVEGEPRPSVTHISQVETKRRRQLCLWDPITYEDYCENVESPKRNKLSQKAVENFKALLKEGFEEVEGLSRRLASLRKYKLTSDEVRYFGFLSAEHEWLEKLETKPRPLSPLFLSKLEWFVDWEQSEETDELKEEFNRFIKN